MKDIETYKPYFQHKPDCAQRTVAPDPAWQAHIEMNNVCTCGRDQALSDLEAHLSTSNGMTEDEIERISDEQEAIAQMAFDPEDIKAYTVGFKSGLRYARDRGMLSSSNVPVVTDDKPNSFDVMKRMSADDRDIMMFPDLVDMKTVKAGGHLTFGVPKEAIQKFLPDPDRYMMFVMAMDRNQYRDTQEKLSRISPASPPLNDN